MEGFVVRIWDSCATSERALREKEYVATSFAGALPQGLPAEAVHPDSQDTVVCERTVSDSTI